MRKFYIPAIAAACLFAVPALAATASSTTATPGTAQIQQDLHNSLTKAGYTDIKIEPGSFLVHAKDKQGNPTEMMISPHSMTEVTAMKSSGTKTSTTTNDSTSDSGTTAK